MLLFGVVAFVLVALMQWSVGNLDQALHVFVFCRGFDGFRLECLTSFVLRESNCLPGPSWRVSAWTLVAADWYKAAGDAGGG